MIKSKKLSKFRYLEHGFFNRRGGESIGIFKSLNCGPGSSDSKKNVLKNIKIVSKKINNKSKKIVLLNQIHSNNFHFINKNLKTPSNKLTGDALITNKKNTAIGILTADCAPILLHDETNKMIAAIHAGWKGAYKGIIEKVIKFMIKEGCSPKNITAVIGPCISVNSYQVRQNFIKKFMQQSKKNKVFFKKIRDKNYFNLNKYIYFQIKRLKIKKIDIIKKDTFIAKNNFFSARRSIRQNKGDYGRNISVIMIN